MMRMRGVTRGRRFLPRKSEIAKAWSVDTLMELPPEIW
jgi:hypothetical protein